MSSGLEHTMQQTHTHTLRELFARHVLNAAVACIMNERVRRNGLIGGSPCSVCQSCMAIDLHVCRVKYTCVIIAV